MTTGNLILKYVICYFASFAMLIISKANGGYKLFEEKGAAQNTGALLGLQIGGVLWLGVVPPFIFDQSWIEIVFGTSVPGLFSVAIIIFLLLLIALFAQLQSVNTFRKIISEHKSFRIFSRAFVIRYLLVRFFFLCGYEIFFRGYLLTDSIQYFGISKAVLLNVTLYTLLHAPADKKEMIACIPFGILLCVVCIWLNAAWPAIVLHVMLSFVYELKLLRKFYNPINVLL